MENKNNHKTKHTKCVYCGNGIENKPFLSDLLLSDTYCDITIINGTLEVDSHNSYAGERIVRNIPINFCPICGKSLNTKIDEQDEQIVRNTTINYCPTHPMRERKLED